MGEWKVSNPAIPVVKFEDYETLRSELEKCKQTLTRYEQMLAVVEGALNSINGYLHSNEADLALAKIEEMRAQK